jgi:uncharacterized hydrophobic protein (TIGR00271 family)
MRIVEGQLPQENNWHVLVALTHEQGLDITWQVGCALADANRGEVVLAIVLPSATTTALRSAQEIITAAETALAAQEDPSELFCIIIEDRDFVGALKEVIRTSSIDLLLVAVDRPDAYDFRAISCAVAVARNATPSHTATRSAADLALDHIIVPTSGGPNSAYALGLLLPLTPEVHITALYVASSRLGESEEALGYARLRQVMDFVDAGDRIESKLITTDSVAGGIVAEAADDCDLVVIGASEESRLDQILFGNLPESVLRQLQRPVMVIRRSTSPLSSFIGALDWRMQTIIPRKSVRERAEIYARIRRGARPETSFFVLIALSAMIAALGLIVNSPAVVIGAMLVAPLMSPIIGTGLAIVMGDTRFLKLTLGAVNRGVLLAIGVGFLAGLFAIGRPPSAEILARTQPTLFDLGIAVFSGMAAAYALSFSQAAGALPGVAIAAALVPPLATVGITLAAGLGQLLTGQAGDGMENLGNSLGALLLFTTNFIAISTAAALVFFILGFRPTPSQKARQEVQRRSARVAIGLLMAVTVTLGVISYILARETAQTNRAYAIVEQQVEDVTGAQVIETNITGIGDDTATVDVVVRSTRPIPYRQVVDLQEAIAVDFREAGIADDLAMTMTVFAVTELDPLNPPTPVPEAAVP